MSDGTEITCSINVDILDFKIFALLMCKGSLHSKAKYLFDLILGPRLAKAEKEMREENEEHKTHISWKSGRMVKIFKRIIWFSEIFPKKYLKLYMQDIEQREKKVGNGDKMKKKKKRGKE